MVLFVGGGPSRLLMRREALVGTLGLFLSLRVGPRESDVACDLRGFHTWMHTVFLCVSDLEEIKVWDDAETGSRRT